MSCASPSRRWKTIGVRLTAFYSVYFVTGVLVLLGLAYLLLSSSLQRKDREAIQAELAELAALYRTGGLPAMRELLVTQEASGTAEPFVVRLLGPDRTTRFLWKPAQWATLDLEGLRYAPPIPDRQWTFVPTGGFQGPLEMTSAALADGALLEVGGDASDRSDVLRRFWRVIVLALVPMLVLGIVGGALLATSALRPIRQIVQAVRAVNQGEMRVRAPTPQTGDELAELVRLFNEMLERIAALVDGMRSALDNVAHELRTPIMRIKGTAELALNSENHIEIRQALGECLEELDQLMTMVNTLMDISEAEAGALKLRREPVDLAALIGEVVEIYHDVAQEKGVALSTAAAPDLWVTADRSRLRQVLANLVDNAIKYTATAGGVSIDALRDDRGAVVVVRDTGVGIPPEELSRIWDRLYRGSGSRGQTGLGLGLSLVRAVVHAHGGHIDVTSRPGVGSQFTVVFPAELFRPTAGPDAVHLSKL